MENCENCEASASTEEKNPYFSYLLKNGVALILIVKDSTFL
jgi:hypothetical protein